MQDNALANNDPFIIDLSTSYTTCRLQSVAFATPLTEADMQIQAAQFASPGKWHLAHTSWFFDTFLLKPNDLSPVGFIGFDYLFNSYYESVGQRQQQANRGLMSRPALSQIMDYRHAVDEAMQHLFNRALSKEEIALIKLGINHEQQHQELFLTDSLYNLSQNPLFPAYDAVSQFSTLTESSELEFLSFDGGLTDIGANGDDFCYDNETPRHQHFLTPFKLANQLVTNANWVNFIEDEDFHNPLLWLSDGWMAKQKGNWKMPLYWHHTDLGYQTYSLRGLIALDMEAPVRHISYFEAEAYARWVGKRLPTEFEWEYALSNDPTNQIKQAFNQLWQWTASPYIAYPGFKVSDGAVGEYNGKFMNGQYVLKGSSFATALYHSRITYRNFFYPDQRWQFCGLRLAE